MTKDKKFVLLKLFTIIVFLSISFSFFFMIIQEKRVCANFEKDVLYLSEYHLKNVFSIDKIVVYSNAVANTNIGINSSNYNLDLSSFSDIAISINNHSDENLTSENTIKQLYIDNISFSMTPVLGTPKLYQKNINDFGKCTFNEDSLLRDKLDFTIIGDKESINEENVFAYDSSLPIVIGYYNENIKEDYYIADSQNQLTIDGSLLERCHVTLSNIETQISFTIHIINNLDEHFICPFSLSIPFEDSSNNRSIYDGSFLYENNNLSQFKFYKL